MRRIGKIGLVLVLVGGILGLGCGQEKEKVQKEEITKLIKLLKDEDIDVGLNAAEALGKIGKPAIEPLIAVLKDKDARVRGAAGYALAEVIGKPAVKPLIEALKDKDAYVREMAAWALTKITGQDFGEDYDKWLKWWEENKDKTE